jgi:hypothetical protein
VENRAKGIRHAYFPYVQQLGNGAIVETLNRGRSFFDGRARGEGSKGYVGKRDAHITRIRSGQLGLATKRRKVDRDLPDLGL